MAQARRLFAAGDFAGAEPWFRKAVREQPKNPEVFYDLGRCCIQMGKFADARRALDDAARLAPNVAAIYNQLARLHLLENHHDAAHKAADQALRLSPESPEIVARKSDIFFNQGKYVDAARVLEPLIAEGSRHPDVAFAFARVAKRVDRVNEAANVLREMLNSTELPAFSRSQGLFLLGGLLDSSKDYDGAFAAYSEANQLRSRGYNPAINSSVTNRLITAWTTDAITKLPKTSFRCELPVFIIGMPRSGTTLVEQILASHPKVFGAGEPAHLNTVAATIQRPGTGEPVHVSDLSKLTSKVIDQAGRDYIKLIAPGAGSASRITDKMPANFVHLGLISAIFPHAKIIHTTRDPLDTCLSCHFQSWSGLFPWTNNLEHIGAYYRDYRRLMEHWTRVLAMPILEVPYEALTRDQESWTRRMIEFIGLPWDDRCLKFYETERRVHNMNQDLVRQPIYTTSVERWRRYESHLAPLKSALGLGS